MAAPIGSSSDVAKITAIQQTHPTHATTEVKSEATPAPTAAPKPESKEVYAHASSAQDLLSRYSSGATASAPRAQAAPKSPTTPVAAAASTGATSTSDASNYKNPKPVSFDIYLNGPGNKNNATQLSLVNKLKGELRPGDSVGIAMEGNKLGTNPKQMNSSLNYLLGVTNQFKKSLGNEGVDVFSKVRFERMYSEKGSFRPGLDNVYNSVLKQRAQSKDPSQNGLPDVLSFDFEKSNGFSGDEYNPHDTQNAANLFKQGYDDVNDLNSDLAQNGSDQKIRYVVEPSVSAAQGTGRSNGNPVTLDWNKLKQYTDGFLFQTQRLPLGTGANDGSTTATDPATGKTSTTMEVGAASNDPGEAAKNAADAQAYGKTAEQLDGEVGGKIGANWTQTQLSPEWSTPQTVIDAAKDDKSNNTSYLWWSDTGDPDDNVNSLLSTLQDWNKAFNRGPAVNG